MPDFTSPDPQNYALFRGNVYFTKQGDDPITGRRHIGNVNGFEFEPSVERLDHYSSMAGTRSKDYSVALEVSGQLTITIEEMTAENMSLALMGALDTDSDGNKRVSILSEPLVRGKLELIGTGDVGPRWNFEYPQVAFAPNGSISLISEDDWAAIELLGEVELVDGVAGYAVLQDSAESA